MTEHVLVVGSGRDLPAMVRRSTPAAATSVICRLGFLAKLRQPTEHRRVIAVRDDAPDTEWIALAGAAHAVHPFTRIATFGERDQDRCAAIGEALGLSTHAAETVAVVHDKQAMRERLRDKGVDSTESAAVRDLSEMQVFTARHGFPCIVKPLSGAGSAGVARVDGPSDLAAAFERASGKFDGLPQAGVLIEQFHDGPQYSVESFSESGEHQVVSITLKFSDPETYVELGHLAPAPLPAVRVEEVADYVGRVLDTLGVQHGATHTEIVLTAEGPRVIETHLRMGGDEIPALTLDATGVDLADCVVRQTVGNAVLSDIRAVIAEARPRQFSAIWFAASPVTGVLDEVLGLDDARGIEGITAVELLVRPGGHVGTLESSDSRLAYARAVTTTADSAVERCQTAIARLTFKMSP